MINILRKSGLFTIKIDRLCGLMVKVMASIVDCVHVFYPWSGETKEDEIGTYCVTAKYRTLRNIDNDCLARRQENVSDCGYSWNVVSFS